MFRVLAIIALITTLFALSVHFVALRTRRPAGAAAAPRPATPASLLATILMLAGLLIQGLTGFAAALQDLTLLGWPLLAHLLGAPLFLAGITLQALLLAGRSQPRGHANSPDIPPEFALQRLILLTAAVVAGSMLLSMTTLFGYAAMEQLLTVHRYSGLLLVVLLLVQAYVLVLQRLDRVEVKK